MLRNLANLPEDAGDKEVAKAIRCIKNTERRTKAYNNLKYQRGKTVVSSSIDQLQVPASWPSSEDYNPATFQELEDPKQVTSSSGWREVTCPTEIQNLVRIRNRMHFGKAQHQGTPFTTPILRERFNWAASTTQAELVLAGNYSDPDLNEIQNQFLAKCCRVINESDTLPTVTLEDFAYKMKN